MRTFPRNPLLRWNFRVLRIGRMRVLMDEDEVWFLEGDLVGWTDTRKVQVKPVAVKHALERHGFNVSAKLVEELKIRLSSGT